MAVSGAGVAYAMAGFVLLWSGVKNATIKDTLTSFLKGQQPTANPTGAPTIGIGQPPAAAAAASSTPAGGVPAVTGNPGAVNGCTASQTAQNKATGQLMAGAYGWGSGAEWQSLNAVMMQESGWCNVAQNPGSTAYGIGQFLDTTWSSVGYTKSSDPITQIAAMLAYIKQRYGDPIKAEQFHLTNNYY